uniref:Uncharacterized protein n=1 Tax=Rhizophora mucronata TaxID=61149 RepID=A0A2P2PZ62_RHIMU
MYVIPCFYSCAPYYQYYYLVVNDSSVHQFLTVHPMLIQLKDY